MCSDDETELYATYLRALARRGSLVPPVNDRFRERPVHIGKLWSGARDLIPGPHGPEPCVRHVLPCPAGSSSVGSTQLARLAAFLEIPLVDRYRRPASPARL
jgi:hypothetical protein